MQGCNQYCTFCIVPYTRGEERSRTHSRHRRRMPRTRGARREGNHPARPDCDELRQTAIGSIDSLAPRLTVSWQKSPFVQLLEAVHEIDGLERIRFTSPHPKGYGDDLVEAYARLPKLCRERASSRAKRQRPRVETDAPRLHARTFLGIIEKLRRARPDIGITTDIIVGFPGETEEDFEQTLSLAREVQFDNAYIFKYSPRRDTPAADMPDQVPQAIREERNHRLLEVDQRNRRAQIRARSSGGRCRFWWKGRARKIRRGMTGRTRCNKIVLFDGSRPASRAAHGREDHARRFLHALRRPGDCECVTGVAAFGGKPHSLISRNQRRSTETPLRDPTVVNLWNVEGV